ncbi:hypothetical protein A2631_04840 [Candidatus Daviesbacteria bacterium RIFCSPHIGHO2_01_FULL_44_29]|uniref:Nudix hydrolase domain-containing protein n=1 Tax=Candidatus Daviesbacteria bacterium RIFCSPHIGHO2_02_FULL_43_12 TaxID=1797776 RepID=A0A1F5KGP0_9BACT|nr:MAG: hypothetical protein A2631_04840 [Candidatus Daviesbacteria bacterium RIFCSPHIGHO2_01_FULL_44_29]OGE40048.1 MAG: hypothetical protein A3D25_04570 [Candidatus Daviesbacteria bacterium RIFCSPHIGHO2_02_FULL_43_12]OGE41470.1 MAG: hypothetical protein A3E86_05240 [Candidatus Daviesbacteria bacterium RIFCSPHIGHO2_12_FULL_47_45]OGE70272.1 MAG: hypothetical protein A3B55_01000 [Candidatus Daviesbacteria bacterium RIFCSPLOWO2_01_FULL_43_15]
MKQGLDYIGVGIGAATFNDQGDLFLAKRSENASNERGCWEVPGGSMHFDETMEETVRREMLEEYGIEIEIIKQLSAEDHVIPEEKQHWIAVTYLAKLKSGQAPKIMEPHKCDAIGWFGLDNLPQPLSIITKLNLKRLKKNG